MWQEQNSGPRDGGSRAWLFKRRLSVESVKYRCWKPTQVKIAQVVIALLVEQCCNNTVIMAEVLLEHDYCILIVL